MNDLNQTCVSHGENAGHDVVAHQIWGEELRRFEEYLFPPQCADEEQKALSGLLRKLSMIRNGKV